MSFVSITPADRPPEVIAVKRQRRARDGASDYAPPRLQHAGNEIDALLAVRLDPTQDDPEADDDA